MSREVVVPLARWPRWRAGFEERNGPTDYRIEDGGLRGDGRDGSWFLARLPFGRTIDGRADPEAIDRAAGVPEEWGVLLVRKGGFAVARLMGERILDSKVGRRHVQGRTKAGGQSQQRFARRRENQARAAYDAAADHAARILDGMRGPVVVGGDHAALDTVLTDHRLRTLEIVGAFLAVPDPRRAVLEAAIVEAMSLRIEVENAGTGSTPR